MISAPLVVSLLLGGSAQAVGTNQCSISVTDGDRAEKGGDVVVRSGETLKDAIAVGGNVIVKSGATVHDAMALNGSVTVEDGAVVHGSVIAVGGKLTISKKAKIEGSQVAVDDEKLHVISDDGQQIDLAASFAGVNLAHAFLTPLLAKIKDCDVRIGK